MTGGFDAEAAAAQLALSLGGHAIDTVRSYHAAMIQRGRHDEAARWHAVLQALTARKPHGGRHSSRKVTVEAL